MTNTFLDIGYEDIEHFEGYSARAYKDKAGPWTIGYGTTGKKVYSGLVIDQMTAVKWMKDKIAEYAPILDKALVKGIKPTNDFQYTAMLCFAYNEGIGALLGSTLFRYHLNGQSLAAANEFRKWVKASTGIPFVKVTLPGLVRRRGCERLIYLGADPRVSNWNAT